MKNDNEDDMDERDFTGFVIIDTSNIEASHTLRITGLWKTDRPEMGWWWKCMDCHSSSGVFKLSDILNFEAKGMLSESAVNYVEEPNAKNKHPEEEVAGSSRFISYLEYDGWYGMD